MGKQERRLRRQFDALSRIHPAVARVVHHVRSNRMRLLRLPLGILMILGGFLSFLPVLGLWMLPLGLLLLALDIPAMRPGVSAAVIRGRQWLRSWRRRLQNR